MNLIIIDYGSGNLRSVENAFFNSITENNLKCKIKVTSNLQSITNADFLILPGVGSYPDCKKGLQEIDGLIEVLSEQVIYKKKKKTKVSIESGILIIGCSKYISEYIVKIMYASVEKYNIVDNLVLVLKYFSNEFNV